MKYGWKSLTAKETGRIGGMISKRKKGASENGSGIGVEYQSLCEPQAVRLFAVFSPDRGPDRVLCHCTVLKKHMVYGIIDW